MAQWFEFVLVKSACPKLDPQEMLVSRGAIPSHTSYSLFYITYENLKTEPNCCDLLKNCKISAAALCSMPDRHQSARRQNMSGLLIALNTKEMVTLLENSVTTCAHKKLVRRQFYKCEKFALTNFPLSKMAIEKSYWVSQVGDAKSQVHRTRKKLPTFCEHVYNIL